MVTQEHLDEGRVYPPLNTIRDVSTKIAVHIVEYAYDAGVAGMLVNFKHFLSLYMSAVNIALYYCFLCSCQYSCVVHFQVIIRRLCV